MVKQQLTKQQKLQNITMKTEIKRNHFDITRHLQNNQLPKPNMRIKTEVQGAQQELTYNCD